MRLVQAGRGPTRNVVLIYHLNESADADVRAAVGPDACILNETVPQADIGLYGSLGSLPTIAASLGWAQVQTGSFLPQKLLLAGFSAGYIAVRTQLQAGADPDAVVIADGIQSPRPGSAADVAVWTSYAALAKKSERIFLASHSTQGETSLLSTTETLRLITGFPLDDTGPANAPVVTEAGKLIVLSFSGNDHHAQGYVVLPKMLGIATGMLSKASTAPPPKPETIETVFTTPKAEPPSRLGPILLVGAGLGMIALGIFAGRISRSR